MSFNHQDQSAFDTKQGKKLPTNFFIYSIPAAYSAGGCLCVYC